MTLHGPDGSHWQAGIITTEADWSAIGFGIWRASIRQRVDETFAPMALEFQSRGLPFAGYHAMYPSSRCSPAAQAATFHLACLGDSSIPAMLDWEAWVDGTASWDDVVATAEELRNLGHVCGLVYTGHGFWTSQGRPDMVGHGLSLVNARYGNNSSGTIADVYAARGGDQGNGWQTYGGLSTVIWQYGSKVTWGNHQMDMNAYRGAPADLGQWFWTPPPPEPVPTPDPVPVPIPDPTPGVTVSNIAGPKRDLRIENRAALNADPLGVVDVQLCQILCNGLLNSGLKIDGDYGPKTTAAATAYQSFSRLKADGWWGAQTWSAVLNL